MVVEGSLHLMMRSEEFRGQVGCASDRHANGRYGRALRDRASGRDWIDFLVAHLDTGRVGRPYRPGRAFRIGRVADTEKGNHLSRGSTRQDRRRRIQKVMRRKEPNGLEPAED